MSDEEKGDTMKRRMNKRKRFLVEYGVGTRNLVHASDHRSQGINSQEKNSNSGWQNNTLCVICSDQPWLSKDANQAQIFKRQTMKAGVF